MVVQGVAIIVGVILGIFFTLPLTQPNASMLTESVHLGIGILIGGLVFGIVARAIIHKILPASKIHPPSSWQSMTTLEKFASLSCAILLVGLSCVALMMSSVIGFVAVIVIFWPPMLVIERKVNRRLATAPASQGGDNLPEADKPA